MKFKVWKKNQKLSPSASSFSCSEVDITKYENSSYNRGKRATVQQWLHCLPSLMIFINTIQHQTQ